MRNAFVDELVAAGRRSDNIALVVGDLGFGVVEPFASQFPERFFNAGVAEQNMMGLAAGLASEGMHVFVYSIANFPTFRCAEQIRNDVAYHRYPVTVVAVGGGLAYGNLGYSHHAVQDYALMRVLPGMLIASPGDPMEVRACMRYLINYPQPSYLRLGKAGERVLHAGVPDVSPGQWLTVRGNSKGGRTFVTTGAALQDVAVAVEEYAPLVNCSVHSLPLWGMGWKADQARQVERFDIVTTVEDHLIDAGMGSWLMESIVGRPDLIQRLQMRGLDASVCGMVGKQATLNSLGGLSRELLCS
jgi:transketolase